MTDAAIEQYLPKYRAELFADRVKPIRMVIEAVGCLTEEDRKPEVLSFRGGRGLGKSWLSFHLARTVAPDAFPQDVLCLLIGLGDMYRSRVIEEDHVNEREWLLEKHIVRNDSSIDIDATLHHLLLWFTTRIGAARSEDASLSQLATWVIHTLKQPRFGQNNQYRALVCVIDSAYETNRDLRKELEKVLLNDLAQLNRVLLVITGRGNKPNWNSHYLRRNEHTIDLGSLIEEETNHSTSNQDISKTPTKLLEERQGKVKETLYKSISKYIEKSKLEQLLKETECLPLNTVLAGLAEAGKISWGEAIDELLRFVPEDERASIHDAIVRISVLQGFRQSELQDILELSEPQVILDKLLTYQLAYWDPEKRSWVLDASLRSLVTLYLKKKDIDRLISLHKAAYTVYNQWFERYKFEEYNILARYHRNQELELSSERQTHIHPTTQNNTEGLKTMRYEDYTKWTGAYAIPELLGREQQIEEVFSAIASSHNTSNVIFIMGEGGIGKTRLLQEIIIDLRQKNYGVVADLIDVYDLDTHNVLGLTTRIEMAINPSSGDFPNYRRLRAELATSEASGIFNAERNLYQELETAFIKDFAAFAADRKVVVTLDTAERMVYSTDFNNTSPTCAEGWRWLAQHISQLRTVTWLLAGRSSMKSLEEFITGNVARSTVTIDALNEEASIRYFDAAAEVARKHGDTEIAESLQALPLEFRKEAHIYAKGRPLSLALLADLLVVQDLPATQALIDSGRPPNLPDQATEQLIITRLIETPEMGDFLIAAGRLRKGFDATLMLTALRVFRPNQTLDAVNRLLEQFRRLSFVKERGGLLFLHDVIYQMLDTQIYSTPTDRPDARKFYDAMVAQNDKQQYELAINIDQLHQQLEAKKRVEILDRETLIKLNRRRQTLLTERLFYLLRLEAPRGFRHYFRMTFDAVLSSDITLDVALEAELLAFLNERDPKHDMVTVDGLERAVCEGVARLRPVARAVAAGQYSDAIRLARSIRQSLGTPEVGGAGTGALLDIWEAHARIYRAEEAAEDLDHAKNLLDRAIKVLTEIVQTDDEAHEVRVWRARGGLAFGYMIRGYLHWSRGRLEAATDDYNRSIQLGREVRVNVNLAGALNDLGFVRAEAGYIADAKPLVEEALLLRRERVNRPLVALSLNTLALINLREGQYRVAIDQSKLAHATFSALNHRRGEVLALIALSESYRRYANTHLPDEHSLHRQSLAKPTDGNPLELLQKAEECTKEAYLLAVELNEKLRQVDALIESGCIARDIYRHRALGSENTTLQQLEHLIIQSRADLRKAAELAGKQYLYRNLDALVNLAFVEFYVGNLPQAQIEIERVEAEFPKEYFIIPARGEPSLERERASVQIWTQLGKLYSLRGHIAFDRYRKQMGQKNPKDLAEAIDHYLLSLKYNSLYSQDHRAMRSVRDQIYNRLKDSSYSDLQSISQYVAITERKYHMRESELRQLLRSRALWVEK